MQSLAWLIDTIIRFYILLVVAYAILSLLTSFNIVNARSQFVQIVGNGLSRLVEPALRPIRRVVPLIGGVDLSPVVLVLLLAFVRRLL